MLEVVFPIDLYRGYYTEGCSGARSVCSSGLVCWLGIRICAEQQLQDETGYHQNVPGCSLVACVILVRSSFVLQMLSSVGLNSLTTHKP